MADLFQDPEFKAIRHVNDELFAVEQLCKQYGLEDVRQALYRVRAHELAFAEIRVRGRVQRETEAGEDGARVPAIPQPVTVKEWPSLDALKLQDEDGVLGAVKPGDCIHCGKEICNDLGWCNSFKAAPKDGVDACRTEQECEQPNVCRVTHGCERVEDALEQPAPGAGAARLARGVLGTEQPMTRERWIELCAARFKWAGCSDFAAKDCAITEFNIRCREEPLDTAPELLADRWPDPAEAADDQMREWSHDGDD